QANPARAGPRGRTGCRAMMNANAPAPTPVPATAPRPAPAARVWWAGLFAVWLPLLAYNLLFFNRYLPLTEGWFSLYARLIRDGQTPYRDFCLFLPPLYP